MLKGILFKAFAFTVVALLCIASVSSEKVQFAAEPKKLLDILTHHVYSKKEVFLRELLSNASDALAKLRILSLTNSKLLGNKPELEIHVIGNEEDGTLTIIDTGIGMSKDDLKKNLGVIAHSGTAAFISDLKDGSDNSDFIGKFGIGFLSSFLVSDKVEVFSKSPTDKKQYVWRSENDGSYSVEEDKSGEPLERGTKIVLHLKNDAKEFAQQSTLESLIEKSSQFIEYKINLWKGHTVSEEVPLTEEEIAQQEAERLKKAEEAAQKKAEKEAKKAEKEAKKAESGEQTEEAEEKESDDEEADVDESAEVEKEPKTTKTVEKVVKEFVHINIQKPIWQKQPKDVTKEDYAQFYRTITKDKSDPLTYSHFSAEGDVNLKGLFYVSEGPKFNPMDPSDLKNKKKLSLYVRKVLISDNLVDVIPNYLGFVTGLIDSEDLQLNISRENFQHSNRLLAPIKKHVVSKILSMLKSFSEEHPEKYNDEFWKNYSSAIKFGIKDDEGNKEKIAKLLRFYTSHKENATDKKSHLTSLASYVERAKEGQKNIYYCMGPSSEEILKSPFAEAALERGYEVLLFDEPFDQFVAQTVNEFNGMKFQDISKGDISFGNEEDEKKAIETLKEEFKPLTDWLLTILKNEIDAVNISKKLVRTPMAVTSKDFGMSGYMMKVMAAQSGSKDNPYVSFLSTLKKSLEINPKHPIVSALNEKVKANEVNDDLKSMAKILFDAAMISSGFDLRDPTSMLNTVDLVLRKTLNLEIPDELLNPKEESRPDIKVDFGNDDKKEESDEHNHEHEHDHEHDEL